MKRYYLIEHIISYLSFVEKLIPICLDEEMHRKLLLELGSAWRKLAEQQNRNENDLLLSGSNSVERSWKRQVDAATARVVARQGSWGTESSDTKGSLTF